jgi:hypothetical protein
MSMDLRLDRLLGREVYTANHRRLGRLHEIRAERRGNTWVVTEYVIGALSPSGSVWVSVSFSGSRAVEGMSHVGISSISRTPIAHSSPALLIN